MASLQELRKYLTHTIADYGGYTSPDYRTFERKYRNFLKKFCEENGYELVNFSPNHYEFTCFIKNKDNKYVYFSISDVRYWKNQWFNNILIRTAKHERDYTGGSNEYTRLDELLQNVKRLFAR